MSEQNNVRTGTKSLLMPTSELAVLAGVSLPTARNLPVKKVKVGQRFKFVRAAAEQFLNGETSPKI